MDGTDLIQILVVALPLLLAFLPKLFKSAKPNPPQSPATDRRFSFDPDEVELDDAMEDGMDGEPRPISNPMDRIEQELKRWLGEEVEPTKPAANSIYEPIYKPIYEPIVQSIPHADPQELQVSKGMEEAPECVIHGDAYRFDDPNERLQSSSSDIAQAFDLRQAVISQCILEPRHRRF